MVTQITIPQVAKAATVPATTATYNPATYDPSLWNIDGKQTVNGQLQGILAGNSPLLQQAETRALQQANAKGLVNSSMAVTAGQSALYDAALPIAQSDANLYASAAQTNANAQNSAGQFNASALNNAGQFNASAQNNTSQFNASAQNTAENNAAGATNSFLQIQMQEENKLRLADIEASYKTLMQTNASAGELYQQSVKNITDLITNPDLDAEAKDAAITQQLGYLKDGMEMFGAINNLNLTSLLNF
jgi:hypothetical protein